MILTKNDYDSKYWLIYVFKNPFFLFVDGILTFTGKNFLITIVEIMGYSGYAIGFMILSRRLKDDKADKLSRNKKAILTVLCIAIVAFIGISNREKKSLGLLSFDMVSLL